MGAKDVRRSHERVGGCSFFFYSFETDVENKILFNRLSELRTVFTVALLASRYTKKKSHIDSFDNFICSSKNCVPVLWVSICTSEF